MAQARQSLPRGVYILASIEFWERFSYYGFLGILVFFLTATPVNGGLGWSAAEALVAVGWITGVIWLAPVVGGIFADRFGGAKVSVGWGTLLLAAGNALLAGAAMLPRPLSAARLGHFSGGADNAVSALFYLGLMAIVLGAGLFKANASALLSQLFEPQDARRERGFSLFYMSINIGALAAPLVAGSLAEQYGWWLGFAASGVGMAIGAATFRMLLWPRVRDLPGGSARSRAHEPGRAEANPRLAPILSMLPFAVLFMSGLMMYGGLLNVFARDAVDRMVGGFEVPATWFLSLNPVFILILGAPVSAAWARLTSGRAGTLALKIAVGLGFASAAFLLLTGAGVVSGDARIPLVVLVAFYALLTVGELCVIPAGLAEIGASAPQGTLGLLMGLWLLSFAAGGVIAGEAGALAQSMGSLHIFLGEAAALTCGALIAAAVFWRRSLAGRRHHQEP